MERKFADWSESASGKKHVKMKKTFPHWVTHSGQRKSGCLCAQIPQHTHKAHISSRWGKQLGLPFGWSQSQHWFPLSSPNSLNILRPGAPTESAPCQRVKPVLTAEEFGEDKLNVAWSLFISCFFFSFSFFKCPGFHRPADDAVGANAPC